MPMTRTRLQQVVRHTQIEFYDESGAIVGDLNLWYRPNALSKAEFRALQDSVRAGEQDEDEGLAPLLQKALVRWDYRHSEDGPDLPVTAEIIAELGYAIQNQIARRLVSAVEVNPSIAPNSGAPSAAIPTPPSPTAPSLSFSDGIGESMTPGY